MNNSPGAVVICIYTELTKESNHLFNCVTIRIYKLYACSFQIYIIHIYIITYVYIYTILFVHFRLTTTISELASRSQSCVGHFVIRLTPCGLMTAQL